MNTAPDTADLSPPYGGTLVDRTAMPAEVERRVAAAAYSVTLSAAQRIHLKNIATGCYSPLAGFMNEREYNAVLTDGKLPGGLDWKVPVLLQVEKTAMETIETGAEIALNDPEFGTLGAMTVESRFEVDPGAYCDAVMGTNDRKHPGAARIQAQSRYCIGGQVTISRSAVPAERREKAPAQIRDHLVRSGAEKFAAFSTRNIPHRGHEYQHRIALEEVGFLGIHVITGATVPGSFLSDVVLDTYEMLIEKVYPHGTTSLNNLRLAPIYAGPNEAFLQATVLQNMGFTHFIVGRDHAGVGDYYGRYASQEIFARGSTLDISVMALPEPQYCGHCDDIVTEDICHRPEFLAKLNGRDVRRMLAENRDDELTELLRPEIRDLIVARNSAAQIFAD